MVQIAYGNVKVTDSQSCTTHENDLKLANALIA